MSVSRYLQFVSDRLQGFFTVISRTLMKVSTLEFNTISDAVPVILGVLTTLELCNEIFTPYTEEVPLVDSHTKQREETNTVCRSLRKRKLC